MPRAYFLLLLAPAALLGCGFGDPDNSDGSPPGILITKPEGTTVHDVVDFAANVIDEGGVQIVEFYVNDVVLGQDFTEPFEVRWNTLNNPDGSTILKVVARDFAGNQSLVTKTVTVANSPN